MYPSLFALSCYDLHTLLSPILNKTQLLKSTLYKLKKFPEIAWKTAKWLRPLTDVVRVYSVWWRKWFKYTIKRLPYHDEKYMACGAVRKRKLTVVKLPCGVVKVFNVNFCQAHLFVVCCWSNPRSIENANCNIIRQAYSACCSNPLPKLRMYIRESWIANMLPRFVYL